MKIALDLQSCQSGSRLGGIGRYSLELARAMVRNHSDRHEFWIVLNNFMPSTEAQVRHEFANLLPQDRIRVYDCMPEISSHHSAGSKVQAAELIREAFLADLDADVVHISSLMEGFQEDIVTSVGRLYPAERTAVTIYDLIPLVQDDRYLRHRPARAHYYRKVEHMKRAGLLLSISEFSRQEAIEVLPVPPDRVQNISSAADARFRPVQVPERQAAELRKRLGITRKFLMYTGSFDMRKNHEALIRAYALLPKDLRKDHQLVIVGNGWEAIYLQLRGIAKSIGLGEEELVFAGHVADADLLPLYNLCTLFVFPSLAEGFGLPVLEAMSCGIPTVCSNCTSLPEVIGMAEAQFDPTSPQSIATVMRRGLADPEFRQRLSANGLAQAKLFSWEASARKAVQAMEQLHERNRSRAAPAGAPAEPVVARFAAGVKEIEGVVLYPDAAWHDIATRVGSNLDQLDFIRNGSRSDLRIGWVTSWNTPCGIAAYSRFLLDHIDADVTVLAAEADRDTMTQPDEPNVVRCWKSGLQAGQLGGVLEQIKRRRIEVLVLQFNYGFYQFAPLREFLDAVNALGVRTVVMFHSTHDAGGKVLADVVEGLRGCHALLVHGLKDRKVLADHGLGDITGFLPQGVARVEPSPRTAPQLQGKTVVACYGFALPGKGLEELLEGFALLKKRGNPKLHLLMVNAEYPGDHSTELFVRLRARRAELGLEKDISFVWDYLPDAESIGWLQMADLVVLPYQATGESSSAAVRMGIAAQRPVAVTPLAIFDDLGEAVFRMAGTTPEHLAAGIEKVLGQLAAGDELARRTAASAELWRKAHDYANVARHLHWVCLKPKGTVTDYKLPRDFDVSQSSKVPLVLDATTQEIKTIVGERNEKGLHTSGQGGNLMHGPWLAVGPGNYRVVIKGRMTALGDPAPVADIATTGGTRVQSVMNMELGQGDTLAVLNCVVPLEGTTDLEARIHVSPGAKLTVTSLEIGPPASFKAAAAPPTPTRALQSA